MIKDEDPELTVYKKMDEIVTRDAGIDGHAMKQLRIV